MNETSPTTNLRAATRLGWFAGLVVLGHVLLMVFPAAPERLGLVLLDHPWLDSHAILAAGDAVRAGIDPWKPNPLDALGRPHCYSSWWLITASLGLSRADNVWIGPLWQVLFLTAALLVLRPVTVRSIVVAGLALFSPPVILGVSRANNDLLIFAILAAGLLTLAPARRGFAATFGAAVILAAGLKFYPLVAAASLLVLRPRLHAIVALLATLGLGGVALMTTQIGQAVGIAPSPWGTMTFGHVTVLKVAGLEGAAARIMAILLVFSSGLLWLTRGWAPRFKRSENPALPEAAFLAGAAILVACFLAAGSYAYRLVFVLLTLPHLASEKSGRAGKVTLGLLLTTMWMDGIFQWGTEAFLEGAGIGTITAVVGCRLILSQFVAWMAVSLLTAGLLEYGRTFLKPDHETQCASAA